LVGLRVASSVADFNYGISEWNVDISHVFRVLKYDMACTLTWLIMRAYVTSLQVSHSNLRDLLLQCCMDDASDVRQSAFALLGDLARVS